MTTQEQQTRNSKSKNDYILLKIAYTLAGFGLITSGTSCVIAFILTRIELKKIDTNDHYLLEHFEYIGETLFYGLIATLISLLIIPFGVGIPLFYLSMIWITYKSINGGANLLRDLPVRL